MIPEKLQGVAAIEQIAAARQAIADAEEQLALAKEQMEVAVTSLATTVEDSKSQSRDAITWLYWNNLDIPAKVIADAFGVHSHDLHEISGTATGAFVCGECQKPIEITSRARLTDLERSQRGQSITRISSFYCAACWQKERTARDEAYEAQLARHQQRLRQLKTMPYRDYLQTPEWQVRREQHLRSAKFRCQICNASGVTLNVHHRSYERRGDENYKDLIVLCQDCHTLFHRQGRLYEGE